MADGTIHATIGSGKLYLTSWSDGVIPEDSVIETDENKIGDISGGAEISAKGDLKQIKDDMDNVIDEYIDSESASLKSGVLTWNLATINKMLLNGELDTSNTDKDILYIGGRSNIAHYLLRFVHIPKNPKGKEIRVTMVVSPKGELSFKFDKDKETVIDVEFNSYKQDTDGTLVKIEIAKETVK